MQESHIKARHDVKGVRDELVQRDPIPLGYLLKDGRDRKPQARVQMFGMNAKNKGGEDSNDSEAVGRWTLNSLGMPYFSFSSCNSVLDKMEGPIRLSGGGEMFSGSPIMDESPREIVTGSEASEDSHGYTTTRDTGLKIDELGLRGGIGKEVETETGGLELRSRTAAEEKDACDIRDH